jgi:uncharacterized protein (DUF1778 family)
MGLQFCVMARPKMEENRAHSASARVRLMPEHDALIRQAAELAGISLSDWMRDRLIRAARREIAEAARYETPRQAQEE